MLTCHLEVAPPTRIANLSNSRRCVDRSITDHGLTNRQATGSWIVPFAVHDQPPGIARLARPLEAPTPPRGGLKGIDRPATAVRYLVVVSIAVSAIDVALEAYLVRAFARAPLLGGLPNNGARAYDVGFVLLGFDLLLWVVTGIYLMVLFKRMMDNGNVIAPSWATLKSHWAIWGWIIPIIALFRLFQVVRQIWQTSVSGDATTDRRPLPGVTKVWWGLFIVRASSGGLLPRPTMDGVG